MTTKTKKATDIAVIGMACIYPGAPDLKTFWDNIRKGYDAITEVPENRWEPFYYDPDSDRIDRFYCKRGGFIDDYADFDALSHGIMPVAAEGAEPDQLLLLETACNALKDAGYFKERTGKLDKTGVIIGKGNYLGAGLLRLAQIVRTGPQIIFLLKALFPGISDEEAERVRKEYVKQLGRVGPDTAIGLVPNLSASRIAARLDFHGPAYTIDAACASSLITVDHACRELHSGRCDFVLAGGAHTCHDVSFWSVFSQLQAVSRNQECRPYDKKADGVLIGEGVGAVILRRLEDAERDGDRIYAVIKGSGVACDGSAAGLMTPAVAGQIKSLEIAWKESGLEPESVGYIEGHGTATPIGDDTELMTLAKFFGKPSDSETKKGLGSIKSMIGHTMPAAGVAGLIKTVMALHNDMLPPSLHCEQPKEAVNNTRFRVLQSAENWSETGLNKIAGINAFGFGGINAHTIITAYADKKSKRKTASRRTSKSITEEETLFIVASSKEEMLETIDKRESSIREGNYRLAVFNPDPKKLERVKKIVTRDKPWRGKQDVWFSNEGLIENRGKTAFIFPGIDSFFEPQLEDVAEHFDMEKPQYLHPENLEQTGVGVIEVNMMLDNVMKKIGITPDHIAGHSIGEWSGYIASNMITQEHLFEFVDKLKPGSLQVPGVLFLAAGCGKEQAEKAMKGLKKIAVSHDNCPHQTIICGIEKSINTVKERLIKSGVICQVLPFQSGFHSPLFKDYLEQHRRLLEELEIGPADVPVWSATNCKTYPDKGDKIKQLMLEHLLNPVQFRQLTEKLYQQGVRVFIQIGVGSLTGFIDDTLKDKSALTIEANVPKRTGMQQLRRVVAALFTEGAKVDFKRVGLPKIEQDKKSGRMMKLQLGVPLVREFSPVETASGIPAVIENAGEEDRLGSEFQKTFQDISAMQSNILKLYQKKRPAKDKKLAGAEAATKKPEAKAPKAGKKRRKSFKVKQVISLDAYPELYDHMLFKQPDHWEDIDDTFPVVPMTMSISLIKDIVEREVKNKKVISVEEIKANRWIPAADPLELNFAAQFISDDKIKMTVQDYFSAVLTIADDYPDPPGPFNENNFTDLHPPHIDAKELYDKRWMFHGPAYQGITVLGPLCPDGIKGKIKVPRGKGSLIDNGGQLFGYWVNRHTAKDKLALPIRVKRVEFYADEPEPGEMFDCLVYNPTVKEKQVLTDMDFIQDGKLKLRVIRWEDKRFKTDDRLFLLMRMPGTHILPIPLENAFLLFKNVYKDLAEREYITYRFLNKSERKDREKLGPGKIASWLAGRIAAKDAVRKLLLDKGYKSLYPAEVTVKNDEKGKPYTYGAFDEDIRISLSHKDEYGVGMAAEGKDVGIDIERIEPRTKEFENISFNKDELKLIPIDQDRKKWTAVFWAAKEALAKWGGEGLKGAPRKFKIEKIIDDRTLAVNGRSIFYKIYEDYAIAWTWGDPQTTDKGK